VICPSCGETLHVGSWPFCAGGHTPSHVAVIDDTLPGGPRWCETMAHEPVWLEGTKSQWKREVAARNLENVVRHDDHYYATQRKQLNELYADEYLFKKLSGK
jgi:hypothetical protein